MRRRTDCLALGIVAAIAGCSARAGETPHSGLDGPGELHVRIDQEAIRAFLQPDRQVHVTGTAKASTEPDVADFSIGVSTAKPSAVEAALANNAAMAGLLEALKRRGVAPKDIKTSHVSITPQYSAPTPAEPKPGLPPEMAAPRVVGYEFSNTVWVTARDLAKVGELLDTALNAGSNQLYGISFRIDDRESVLAGLRAKAFDDARSKAEAYAGRAGMELGPVAQITEADPSWMAAPGGPGPMMMAAPMAPGPAMPVSPGEQEVGLTVQVSFELVPKK